MVPRQRPGPQAPVQDDSSDSSSSSSSDDSGEGEEVVKLSPLSSRLTGEGGDVTTFPCGKHQGVVVKMDSRRHHCKVCSRKVQYCCSACGRSFYPPRMIHMRYNFGHTAGQ